MLSTRDRPPARIIRATRDSPGTGGTGQACPAAGCRSSRALETGDSAQPEPQAVPTHDVQVHQPPLMIQAGLPAVAAMPQKRASLASERATVGKPTSTRPSPPFWHDAPVALPPCRNRRHLTTWSVAARIRRRLARGHWLQDGRQDLVELGDEQRHGDQPVDVDTSHCNARPAGAPKSLQALCAVRAHHRVAQGVGARLGRRALLQ